MITSDKVRILFPNSLFDKHLMAEKVATTAWVSLEPLVGKFFLNANKYPPKCAIFPISLVVLMETEVV